ncbi:hypothetical protein RHEC894_PE00216 (plasmid) [Rhizobium sp. CIAT894]|nr:hypothetical protein RHEC894_PE00216 [Rhizobium sp. CIAT894]
MTTAFCLRPTAAVARTPMSSLNLRAISDLIGGAKPGHLKAPVKWLVFERVFSKLGTPKDRSSLRDNLM